MSKKIVQLVDPIVTAAIQKQVEFESLVEWALKETPDDAEVMKVELPSGKGVGHGFPLQVFKYFQL